MTAKNEPINKVNGNGYDQSPAGPLFTVNTVYVKDISFESPSVPTIFNAEWQPKVDFDLQMAQTPLKDQNGQEQEGLYEVVIHLTSTVKLADDTTAFLIEVQQAGIFVVQGFDSEATKHILSTACPTVLFPYARETVSNLVQRGGFPQLLLPPINFEAMYAQHLAQQQEQTKKATDLETAKQ